MFGLTQAPLPGWDDIAKVVTQKNVTDALLAKPWLRENEKTYWFSRSAWSLYAIAQLRMRVKGHENICVWFPDYFCNASLAPLRSLGVKIDFYPVSDAGCPDLSVCESMLENGKPDFIVLVHYFGSEVPAEDFSHFAHKNDAWLIEDSAHVLKPFGNVGNYGDFVLYSPHKLLPVPEGALLLAKSNISNKITDELLVKYDFEGLCHSLSNSSQSSSVQSCKWFVKRILQKLGVRPNNFQYVGFNDDPIAGSNSIPHPKMGSLARRLLLEGIGRLDEEAKIRKVNMREWYTNLEKNKVTCGALKPLNNTGIPYLAAFSCDTSVVAEKMYNSLIKSRIPVTTWPDLPPEVKKNSVRHKLAISMRETRLFFPVHSSINSSIIQVALKDVLS